MSRDKALTEALLQEALDRLLKGQPRKINISGKLTLNKINDEAGLSHSYVYKFTDFVTRTNPLIKEYNLNRDRAITTGLDIEVGAPLSEIDNLKAELARERKLKDKYRLERDNAIEARKLLEAQHSELMFRAYELQVDLQGYKKVVAPFSR